VDYDRNSAENIPRSWRLAKMQKDMVNINVEGLLLRELSIIMDDIFMDQIMLQQEKWYAPSSTK